MIQEGHACHNPGLPSFACSPIVDVELVQKLKYSPTLSLLETLREIQAIRLLAKGGPLPIVSTSDGEQEKLRCCLLHAGDAPVLYSMGCTGFVSCHLQLVRREASPAMRMAGVLGHGVLDEQ